jgi:ubiquinone/menaquinone biosynthesis C-methylase UbiE
MGIPNNTEQDWTPEGFSIKTDGDTPLNVAKRLIRKYIYPIYNKIKEVNLEKEFKYKKKFQYNNIFSGQRGNDYETHRRTLNNYCTINNSTILVIGCGKGQDLEGYLKYKPKKIVAIDLLNYRKAWNLRSEYLNKKYNIVVDFFQADAAYLSDMKSNTFDIVASDAVFAHLTKYNEVINELHRVLKSNGTLYATFGPLWHCYGGDMVSGNSGYDHLLLTDEEYKNYLDGFGEYIPISPDSRIWILNNLLSKLKPEQYMDALSQSGFKKMYVSAIISKKAIYFRKNNPDVFGKLLEKYSDNDLLVESLALVFRKVAQC